MVIWQNKITLQNYSIAHYDKKTNFSLVSKNDLKVISVK